MIYKVKTFRESETAKSYSEACEKAKKAIAKILSDGCGEAKNWAIIEPSDGGDKVYVELKAFFSERSFWEKG